MNLVLWVRLAMEKHVPIVVSVHIHWKALLLVHCVCPVHRNPTSGNQSALIVWLGRLAMDKHVPNAVSVRLLRKDPLLAQHVNQDDIKICQANQIATIATRVHLQLPQVLPPAWSVCQQRNPMPPLSIVRLAC